MSQKFTGLRFKLILPLMVLSAIVLIYARFIWVPEVISITVQDSRDQLQETLVAVGESLTPLLLGNQLSNIYDTLNLMEDKNSDWAYLALEDARGQSLYPLVPRKELKLKNKEEKVTYDVMVGRRLLARLTLVHDLTEVIDKITQQANILFASLVGLIALFAFSLGGVLEFFVIRPASLLVKASDALAQGDFEADLPTANRDEVGAMVRSFDVMRDHIGKTTSALQEAKVRAVAADRAKTRFLASISHELRTPMNGIIGLSSMLQEAKLNPEQAEGIRLIHDEAEGLLMLLSNLLDFSKIEAGEMVLENAPMDVRANIEKVMNIQKVQAAQKGLPVDVSFAPLMKRQIVGDAARIRQILFNLVDNAIKYTAHGSVRVVVDSALSAHGQETLVLQVHDTGVGISPVRARTIFASTTGSGEADFHRFSGIGLGLMITKRLLEKMEGTISFESEEGKGSSFRVDIPVQPLSDDGLQSGLRLPVCDPAGISPVALDLSVLIVDDEYLNIMFARMMVQKIGCSAIDVATSGEKGVEMVRARSYDVILMDCRMQGMDGYEATRRIRHLEQERGGRASFIIGVTADATQEAKEMCLACGMDHYMSKPLNQEAAGDLFRLLGAR